MSMDFQSMPKRFMVWDKRLGKFLKHAGEIVYDLPLLTDLLDTFNVVEIHEDLVVVQSTNLFGEDGAEIFEGSIIRDEDEGYLSVVEYRNGEYCGVDPYDKEVIDSLDAMKTSSEVIGHILSNPELLEEE